MKTREWCIVLCVVLIGQHAIARVGDWRNYTSMEDVRGIARTENTFWAATSGGLFSWREGETRYERFTNAEGLRNAELTAVAVDRGGSIWSGSSTGVIHLYTPPSGSWRYILDIAGANQTNKTINRFVVHGDSLLICTAFGLSVFDNSRFQFGDTYTKFGTLPANVRVDVIDVAIFEGNIWAAISSGPSANFVAVASLSNPNNLPPESWTLQTVGNTSIGTNALSEFNGTLYAGTSQGLFYYSQGAWLIAALSGTNIVGVVNTQGGLAVCTFDGVWLVDAQHSVSAFGEPLPFTPTSITTDASGNPAVGTLSGGILYHNGSWISRFPNGPNSNLFTNIAIEPDGTVWGASGQSGNGKGFYRLKNGMWKSFTMENSGLPTNDYFRVSLGCNGSVWASSWGRGVVEIPAGVDSVLPDRIYGENIGMVGLPNDSTYIVVSTIQCDSRGNTWMTINTAKDKNIISLRKADGSWLRMPVRIGTTNVTTLLDNIPVDRTFALDGFGNVWAASRDGSYKGVISMNNRGEIRDSVVYLLNGDNGLPSNDVKTIVVDRDNDIWVGTDRGIAIILDPDRPTRSGSVAGYRPLNGLVINTIAVDALNQKWVGTNEGVIHLSADGTQQLASYTVESTGGKLIDNDVKSIAVDTRAGTVYFGTANGLASLTTAGSAPKPAFDVLEFSPQPYVVPNALPLTVDGLVENSTIRILSIDGRMIRNIITPGGRIGFWDGKDDRGQDVATGVYIVVAYSEDGSKVATGKVAIVRR